MAAIHSGSRLRNLVERRAVGRTTSKRTPPQTRRKIPIFDSTIAGATADSGRVVVSGLDIRAFELGGRSAGG